MVKTWKLSEPVESALLYQNDPQALSKIEPEHLTLCASVRLANDICLLKGIGVREPKTDMDLLNSPGAKALELSAEKINEFSENISEKYQVEKNLFN